METQTKKFPFWGVNKTLAKNTLLGWDEKAALALLFTIYYANMQKPYSQDPQIGTMIKTLGLPDEYAFFRLENRGLIHLSKDRKSVVDFEYSKIEKLGLVDPGFFTGWD